MKLSVWRLELLLARRGMNLGKLSNVSGVSRQTISTIKGRGTCKPETAGKLARALEVDIGEIIEEG